MAVRTTSFPTTSPTETPFSTARSRHRAYALGAASGVVLALLVTGWPSGRQAAALVAVGSVGMVTTALARAWPELALQSPAARARRARLAEVATVERRLAGLVRPHRGPVAAGLLVTVAMTAVGLAKPWPTKILIDDVFGDGHLAGLGAKGALAVAVALTAGLFVVGGALTLVQMRILYDLTQRIIRDLRADVFRHLAGVSLRFHDERGVGDTAYRVSADTYAIHGVLLSGAVPVTSAMLTLVGMLVIMVAIDPLLAALSLVSVPGAAALSHRFGRRIRHSSQEVQERESGVWSHAEQTFTGIRTVQAFARESYEGDRFAATAERSRGAMVRLVTQQTVFGLAVDAVLGLGLALVTWVAATRALDGHFTVGELIVFLSYAAILYGPISELAGVFGQIQTAAAAAHRVFEVLDEPHPPEPDDATPPAERAVGHLVLQGVTFGYAADHPVLHGVDLDVPPGDTVALVGPTGVGKSTLVSLLLRLYDPDEGHVRLDGADLRDLPLAWLREQIAFVPQDTVLFPTTVRENIRYGRLDASDAEVEEAARRANLLDELLADPRGIDAPVGDRGVTLSGGQRQRVAIARAFLKDAPVVLLDEPTSALDAGTEVLVMDALWRLIEGRTCLVIAHRLATVHRVDRVVVLDGGGIVQQGSHLQLMRRRGLYRELHAARFGRERARDRAN